MTRRGRLSVGRRPAVSAFRSGRRWTDRWAPRRRIPLATPVDFTCGVSSSSHSSGPSTASTSGPCSENPQTLHPLSTGSAPMTSTEGSTADSPEIVDPKCPLWKYTTKVDKIPGGGGNFIWICNICKNSYKSSYTRVTYHLLKKSGLGIQVCKKVSATDFSKIQREDEEAREYVKNKQPRSVPLPPSTLSSSSAVKTIIYKHEGKTEDEQSTFFEVVYDILVDRWTKNNTPLHCLAHALNPMHSSEVWINEDPKRVMPHKDAEVSDLRAKCFRQYFPDLHDRNILNNEYLMFIGKKGPFGDLEAVYNSSRMDPTGWWTLYGNKTPLLQKIALRIMSQPSSSSCA